jgi:hypothetical protein
VTQFRPIEVFDDVHHIDEGFSALLKSQPGLSRGRGRMAKRSFESGAHDYSSDAEELRRLEAAMERAPQGAMVVSGIAVGLLIICWLLIYTFVFLPRGPVG